MEKRDIIQQVTAMAYPIAEENGLELVDVEWVKEGKNYFLRVFIAKEEGIFIEDCQKMSEALSKALDEIDPIKQPYHLEVSSPGIDRPLQTPRDFERAKGQEIEIKLLEPQEGEYKLIGALQGYQEGVIEIRQSNDQTIRIEKNKTSQVKRTIRFS